MQKDDMFLHRWSHCLSSLVGRAFGWTAVRPGIASTCRFETLAAHVRPLHGPHNAKTRQINAQTNVIFSTQSCYKPTRPFANGLESAVTD